MDEPIAAVLEALTRAGCTPKRHGEAVGVFTHPDVPGPINLVWGREGTEARNYEDGFGLAKIDKKHPGAIDKLESRLPSMKLSARESGTDRIILRSADQLAVIKLLYNDAARRFLITTYELNEKTPAAGERTVASSKPVAGPGGEAASPSGATEYTTTPTGGNVKKQSAIERIADRLQAQAAELTKGGGPAGIDPRSRGATNLPAELVALAYRTAAQILRTADRSYASIKSALESLIAQENKAYTDDQKRAAVRFVVREVRKLDADKPKPNDRKTVAKMIDGAKIAKSPEKYREGIRRVSEAVALARADEKAKGLDVIERYDKARKSVRKAIEDNLPVSERGRFLAMLDNAKTPLQVASGMRRVAAAAVSLDARALIKSVDSMSGVMELRKLSAERRAEADDLLAQAEALRPAVGRPDAEDPSKMQAMAAAAKTLKEIDRQLAFLYADQKAADKTFAADKRRTAAEHAKVFIDNISAVKDADPRGSGKAGASRRGRRMPKRNSMRWPRPNMASGRGPRPARVAGGRRGASSCGQQVPASDTSPPTAAPNATSGQLAGVPSVPSASGGTAPPHGA